MSQDPDERDNPYDPEPVPPPRRDSRADDGRDTADDAPSTPDDTRTQRIDPVRTEDSADAEPWAGAGRSGSAGPAAADPDGAVTSTFDVREAGRTRPSGSLEGDRPTSRAGLVEHGSARSPAGDRVDHDRDQSRSTSDSIGAPTAWLAAGGAAGSGASRAGAADEHDDAAGTRRGGTSPDRSVVLDGTTALTRPPSRKGAHAMTVLLTLLLTPVAWYLLADAGARLTLPQGAPWSTGSLNVAALLELAGGLLVLTVVLLAARSSSLGAIVTGSLVFVVGAPFVAAPGWTQERLEPVVGWLDDLGAVGRNVAHHLEASGSTGRLVVYGLALILVGVVSHGARRKGRHEVRPVVED